MKRIWIFGVAFVALCSCKTHRKIQVDPISVDVNLTAKVAAEAQSSADEVTMDLVDLLSGNPILGPDSPMVTIASSALAYMQTFGEKPKNLDDLSEGVKISESESSGLDLVKGIEIRDLPDGGFQIDYFVSETHKGSVKFSPKDLDFLE